MTTNSKVRVAIHGAAGRMGRRLIALGSVDKELSIVAALEGADNPLIGQDAGLVAGVVELNVPFGSHIHTAVDAVIDFSIPEACLSIVKTCVEKRIPLVVATTGLHEEEKHEIRRAAEVIPIVWSPSMSTTVNLAMKLCAMAGTALRSQAAGVDVEIIERHHRYKEDAPSGTALKFGEIIAGVMDLPEAKHGRHGMTGKRPSTEIGYHAVRTGDNPGEHTIVFGLLGETLEVTVKASNRDCYATGALSAAKFIAGKPPGLYSMYDVLGL
ncbi:dihydrodipicolinate reductase [Pirellula staleyi DSM 6068]|uniref:4-hydroxy-tetrahydrodipicolinate reductase n=1 Tax=Pirellula staleyi (strain ATCC 27377 / DSM 6068 / ICPB 4128) TaxID=530564 RepID=D2R4F5_PIRSD|nr:4-hydroxy-tetrahydrodipicolinate reductase [Pirellula staleyi]ADB15303.1 dihydrodipicolinate reductase [Pirellula staleyi DSM 6068]